MTTIEVEKVQQDGIVLVGQAEEVEVTDAPSFQRAGLFLRNIAGYLRKVGEIMDPIVAAAHHAHKVATEQRNKLTEPARVAERLVKTEMAKFEQSERDRVAREQRAAESERQRLEDEERLKNAERLEKAGRTEAAAAALTAPVDVPVFTPPVQAVAKADGVSFRDNWGAVVLDPMVLIRAVADGTAPANLVIPDKQALNALARALKGEMRVPGVEARNERISAVRA